LNPVPSCIIMSTSDAVDEYHKVKSLGSAVGSEVDASYTSVPQFDAITSSDPKAPPGIV